jgi:hypothetical protein
MTDFTWRLHDDAGTRMRETQSFSSQHEAETWMGTAWSELLDEGALSVSLLEGEETLYEMGLGAE